MQPIQDKLKVIYNTLEGSPYEIGQQLGNFLKQNPQFLQSHVQPLTENHFSQTTSADTQKMLELFDTYCPGINEELQGFCDALDISLNQALYYTMTYLQPGCSHVLLLPSMTENGHLLLERNYEFNDLFEDHLFLTTKVKGKYAHIGSSCMLFGRVDGMNECGLSITQSSAGVPVANLDFLRKPAFVGLNFWAIMRTILENCKDINEAIDYMQKVPLAYNINLIVADKSGQAALIETLDGKLAIKRIDANSSSQCLYATNHIHLEPLSHIEPKSMRNSVVRYKVIEDTLASKEKLSVEDLKTLSSTLYPNGLCCHYYNFGFGTLRGMVFDLTEEVVHVSFGSTALNPWHTFKLGQEPSYQEYEVDIIREESSPDLFELI